MTADKSLCIILPSYNDARIERAIRSVRCFDDAGIVKIVLIDGGSKPETLQLIRRCLAPGDVLVSEPDKGIFDALNKGLDRSDTPYIGWLGSDDVFTGNLRAGEVVRRLQQHDMVVANAGHFRGEYITRVTHGMPSRLGMVRYGLNNPHFATFGSAALLKSERFQLGLRGADIEYFIRIFARKPRVDVVNVVATLAEEGGYSTGSYRLMMGSHLALIRVYADATNWVIAVLSYVLKFGYRLSSLAYYRLFRTRARDCSKTCLTLFAASNPSAPDA
jgi:glycosyltransferase involved in cell wall biosynthesis